MRMQEREDLEAAEAYYKQWVGIGLSAGVALEKSAECYCVRKSDLKKYMNRFNMLPEEFNNG